MSISPNLNCLVVDDEPPARAVIRNYIARIPQLKLVGECANAIEAFSILREHPVDIIFLDIKMPQMKGTDFVKSLKTPPKIIITTAYTEYALEGYELDIVDYLVKPIEFERFMKAVNKILLQKDVLHTAPASEKKRHFFYFRADRKMVKIFLADIYYIESLKEYVKIVAKNQTIITKNSITSLESILPPDSFLRIQRSFIVSVDAISSFTNETIEIGKLQLPIGKLYRQKVLEFLNK
jgi:two-component system, LytTR family, response regulator